MKEVINTNNAPAPIGPYSQAIAAGNFLFISGQIPLDPLTGELISGRYKNRNQTGNGKYQSYFNRSPGWALIILLKPVFF